MESDDNSLDRHMVMIIGERVKIDSLSYYSTNVLSPKRCIEKGENFKIEALTLTFTSLLSRGREDRETELRMAPDGGGHKMASQNPVTWRFGMDLRLAPSTSGQRARVTLNR
jgi:hypothetical protein